MTMTNGGTDPTPAATTDGPSLNVMAQYTKDFSFENPNAPNMLMRQQQPQIGIQINVTPKQLSNTDYEVELKLDGKAEAEGQTLFAFELSYGGLFRLQNIPAENLAPLLMIECPRLLFPFAREIVASAVIGGGFPPLMLDPVDFVKLYQQKAAEMQGQQAATPEATQ